MATLKGLLALLVLAGVCAGAMGQRSLSSLWPMPQSATFGSVDVPVGAPALACLPALFVCASADAKNFQFNNQQALPDLDAAWARYKPLCFPHRVQSVRGAGPDSRRGGPL